MKDCLVISNNSKKSPLRVPRMPRLWFCFKFGEVTHITANFSNKKNPTLVSSKNAEQGHLHVYPRGGTLMETVKMRVSNIWVEGHRARLGQNHDHEIYY